MIPFDDECGNIYNFPKDVSIGDKIGWWHNWEKLWKERFVSGFFSAEENTIFTAWKYLRPRAENKSEESELSPSSFLQSESKSESGSESGSESELSQSSFLPPFYTNIDNCSRLLSNPMNNCMFSTNENQDWIETCEIK